MLLQETWGEKELFNSKYPKGYFYYISFSSLPNSISNIIKEWNIHSNIIKHTLIRK